MTEETLPEAGQGEDAPEMSDGMSDGSSDLADVFSLDVPEPPQLSEDLDATSEIEAVEARPVPREQKTGGLGQRSEQEVPAALAFILGPDDEAEADVAEAPAAPSTAPVITIGTSNEMPPSNADVISVPKRRFRKPHLGLKGIAALAVLGGLMVLSGVGISYAAYDYGRDYSGKIMPGATIAGVHVGGMTRDEAIAEVGEAIEPQLTRTISLNWGARRWKVTPEKLGARNDTEAAVDAALAASQAADFLDRARMRLLSHQLDFDRAVAIEYPRKSVRSFVEGLASSIDRPARDASADYESGWIKVVRELEGREVRVGKTFNSLMDALEHGSSTAPLAVAVEMPKTTTKDFQQILLLRIGENKLYLYQRGKITHTYTVATGQPSYPTPTGEFEIVEKRYMPTWVNPAPTTWGANMPASIPPGYGNPLGLRALNWSAPAIRFHGTSAEYSLGYNASHGCVRMSNPDVIELYDLVDVGTPIISVVVAPLRPLYSSAPDPTVVAEDAGEEAPETGADEPGKEKPEQRRGN